MLADQPTVDELRREIDRLGRRVAELERENEVLCERNEEHFDAVPRDAFDSIRDGVALYDAGDRLVFFNDRYVELYELIADRIVAGTTFEALGVAAIELGLFPGDGDSQRVRFERRAANREIRRGVIDIECAGGVWRRISERRTSDGGMVSVHSDITEEMERERAIREHRDKLRLLTDSLPAVVGYLDADRRHQLFNRTGREWFDLDGAQDPRDLDIAPPLGAAGGHPLHDRLRAAFAGETIVFEETMSFPDGETRDVEVSYVPDRADDGSVRGIFSLAANITERNRVAAALRENERRFRDFALATSDWLWEADANFRITWGSDGFPDSDGDGEADFVGKAPWELRESGADGRAAWERARGALAPDIAVRNIRHRIDTEAGAERFWNSSCIGLFDDDGRLVGVRGSTSDVTLEERARRRAIQAETRLRDALEALPVGFLWFDAHDRLVMRNQEAINGAGNERIAVSLGASFESLVRASIASGDLPDGREDVEAFVADRMAAHRDPDRPLEIRLIGDRWARVREQRMADGSTIVIRVDITDLKHHQRALVEAKQAADRASSAKSRFLAAASHDLHQPLQALTLMLDMLASHIEGGEAGELVTDAHDTLRVMTTLLNGLLDISKLDAGLVLPVPEPFRIGDIVERLARRHRAQAVANGISLRVVGSDAVVWSDAALLERIVGNLLANALRYAPDGRVVMGCRRLAGAVRLEVWDTGIGIPAEELGKIFRELHQIGSPDRSVTRGLGLGLAIVDRLSRLLDFRVCVRSTVGRGSVFSLEIPLSESVVPIPEPLPAIEVDSGRLAGLKVLLIEDDVEVRRVMTRALEVLGVGIWAAEGREEALRAIASDDLGRPDLIIADFRLAAGERGTRLVSEIRYRLRHPVAASIITGDTTSGPLREIHVSGCRPLYKPVGMATLKGILGQALALRDGEAVPEMSDE